MKKSDFEKKSTFEKKLKNKKKFKNILDSYKKCEFSTKPFSLNGGETKPLLL